MQGGSFFSLLLVYHNQKHISMQKEKSLRPTAGRFGMRSAFALRIFSGKNILNFAFVALCGALQTHFHGRGRNGKRHLQRRFLRKRGAGVSILALSVTYGDSSPKGRALGSPRKLHLFAKASPFGRGGFAKQRRRGRGRLRGTSPIFSLPCNDPPRSTVCSTGKVSEFCPAAEGRKADRMPVLGRQSCAFCRF